jgi:hypothetical protein
LLAAGGGGLQAHAHESAHPTIPPRHRPGSLERLFRSRRAFVVRVRAARLARAIPPMPQPDNGDEERYPTKIASFSKGLPHDRHGEVDLKAYAALLRALRSGEPEEFERIPLGGPADSRRTLVNPQAALAFDLEGPDSHALAIPPAPRFAGAEVAGEMVEDYWMALLRDIPFARYDHHPLTRRAARELGSLSAFRGPAIDGRVTPRTLFRGTLPGCLVGPYISQFLWRVPSYGAGFIESRIRTGLPGRDFMTTYHEWLAVQNGYPPSGEVRFDPVRRYVRSGRDLALWVMVDRLYQAYFQALLLLLGNPTDDPELPGIATPFDPGNPYVRSRTQKGFATFGAEQILTLVAEVSTRAAKAVWYQKWLVHRRLRPEEFGGRVHGLVDRGIDYPIHPQLLESEAVGRVRRRFGTALLPQAFPGGGPQHPSYAAGHAAVAGACVTVLKAFFDGSHVIPDPVVGGEDGLRLLPYRGAPLTVENELNKLAANISLGRDFAGVHYRSDGASLQLGEAVAIQMLTEKRLTYNERFHGFTLRKFDGSTVTV